MRRRFNSQQIAEQIIDHIRNGATKPRPKHGQAELFDNALPIAMKLALPLERLTVLQLFREYGLLVSIFSKAA